VRRGPRTAGVVFPELLALQRREMGAVNTAEPARGILGPLARFDEEVEIVDFLFEVTTGRPAGGPLASAARLPAPSKDAPLPVPGTPESLSSSWSEIPRPSR
jgi:hypothetical protein